MCCLNVQTSQFFVHGSCLLENNSTHFETVFTLDSLKLRRGEIMKQKINEVSLNSFKKLIKNVLTWLLNINRECKKWWWWWGIRIKAGP